jgi:hypothetical protein
MAAERMHGERRVAFGVSLGARRLSLDGAAKAPAVGVAPVIREPTVQS